MAEMQFTPTQQCAIDSRSSTVLVSAAAGSGKTRVLTERLMAYLPDPASPVDIDSFLIITYTRAAAAEMLLELHSGSRGSSPRFFFPLLKLKQRSI